jgi:hypothetical protein
MMRPFCLSEPSKLLFEQYPKPDVVLSFGTQAVRTEIDSFNRLWLSEGIPFAFREIPMLYEAIREWLAPRLNTHPKYITLVGSARLGFSFDPKKYGASFGPASDLDFAVVSPVLFQALSDDFFRWETDFEAGRVSARNPREQVLWQKNFALLPENISRGFIDAYKIPCWDRYPAAQKVKNLEWHLQKKISLTSRAPNSEKASMRVFNNWESLLKQMRINFKIIFSKAVAS